MVGWQHQLNGHEFEHAPGDCEGQGSLARCSPWDCKESYMTELNCYVKEIIMLHLSLLKQHFRIYRVLKCDLQKMNIFIENFCFIC